MSDVTAPGTRHPPDSDQSRGPAGLVLMLLILLGTVVSLATPPFMAPDEGSHFLRAYEVSEGRFLPHRLNAAAAGDDLPASVAATIDALSQGIPGHPEQKFTVYKITAELRRPLAPDVRQPQSFNNTALYSPLPYAPQAFGIWLGRLAGGTPLVLMYCGRLANVLAAALLVFLAVRAAPLGTWTLAALAVTPMPLFLLGSLSADAATFGLCFLFIGLVWRACFVQVPRMTVPLGLALLACSIGLGLCKPAYFSLSGLIILIPTAAFGGSAKRKWGFVGVALAGVAVSLGFWSLAIRPLVPERDAANHAALVLQHPAAFLGILVETYHSYGEALVRAMLGEWLGWLDAPIPFWIIRVVGWTVLVVALTDPSVQIRISAASRIWHAAVAAGTLAVVGLLLYISWTPADALLIEGLQGRYFIPVEPLVLFVVANQYLGRWTRAERWMPALLVLYAIHCGVETVLFEIQRYYLS